MTVTPDLFYTTLSDHVHVFTTHLLYVPLFSVCLYSSHIATNWWVLCSFCLSIWLPNMFLFMIPVTHCSHSDILTNTICLRDLVTYITKLTHHAMRTVLVIAFQHSWPPKHCPIHSTLVYKPTYSICCHISLNIEWDTSLVLSLPDLLLSFHLHS